MSRRKWSIDELRAAVKQSTSIRGVLQKLKLVPAGGNYNQIENYIHLHKIDRRHFKGHAWNKGMTGTKRPLIPLSQILKRGSTYQSFKLKRRLFDAQLKSKKCEECGWAKMSVDGYLPLELDHINGVRTDNRLENLRILCPNCHSLKPTHRGKNRGKEKIH